MEVWQDDSKYNKAKVARLNRHDPDFVYFLATARIEIVGEPKALKDSDLEKVGIKPLPALT